jgi:hypothetical protein
MQRQELQRIETITYTIFSCTVQSTKITDGALSAGHVLQANYPLTFLLMLPHARF